MVLIFLITVITINYRLIDYGISQAKGQFKIVRQAKPNSEWLNNPDFPDSLKRKLKLVDEIKRFAFDSLGIDFSENYSSMYDQGGEPVMFVVSACKPYELVPRKFSFPIIGSFSYKGFFVKERAEKEEEGLIEKGYDTNIRTAGGWSTLGWFNDPILSEMLSRSDGYLTETIIHELTHGTLFVKDSLTFNENLASFIGWHGARKFLKNIYGGNSKEYLDYINHWQDRRIFVSHILSGAKKLDSLYQMFEDTLTIEQKEYSKRNLIDAIVNSIDTLPLSNSKKYKEYFQSIKINNTFFMSYLRYNGEIEILEKELRNKYNNDIKMLLLDYKS